MHTFWRTTAIFLQCLRRDVYVYKVRLKRYGINYLLILPALYIFAFAYIQPNVYFGPTHTNMGTMLFVGNVAMLMISMAFGMTAYIIYDLENDRFTDYQITILSPRLFIIEVILFAAIFSFCMLTPFFPLAKLVLQSAFDTSNTSWIKLMILLFVSSFFCASYMLFALLTLKNSSQIQRLWLRFNIPLVFLGGFWVPWYILSQYSPLFGYLTLANPFIYITEGLRSAIIGGDQFISFGICVSMLIILATACLFTTFYVFKKKVDHI